MQIWVAVIRPVPILSMVYGHPHGENKLELHCVFPLPTVSMSVGLAMWMVAKLRSGGEVVQPGMAEQSITGSV